jgi:hypothetical protein
MDIFTSFNQSPMSIKRIFLFLALPIFLFSACHLDDFQFDKLTSPTGLTPDVYQPVASGTYLVKDFSVVPGLGSTPVLLDSISFALVTYNMTGLYINTSTIKTMQLIVKTVNETPMMLSYKLSFIGKVLDSGKLRGASLTPQGAIISFSADSLVFQLTTAEVENLSKSVAMNLSITMYQPFPVVGPVLANVLKNSRISVKIGFRSPLSL